MPVSEDDRTPWGRDEALLAARALLERAAAAALPILVLGESGTGKERAARAAHAASGRASGPFVALNCGAIPDALIESELFGHARGAFTGAFVARAGLLEAASGGTLFFDEVGDASALLQAKLLRVLADGTFRRVGETRERVADVRVVAATHRDLEADVQAHRFREDLWYRLAAVEVRLPPLRARGSDVLWLAARFLSERVPGAEFDAAAKRALLAYAWPGNVRELEWAVARAAMDTKADASVPLSALPERMRAAVPATARGLRAPRTPRAARALHAHALASEITSLEERRIREAL
ncbi:MAG: sigma 54-interacting transcriptional regulator, partial [Candidatus Eiseniibacteriota bacterium]